MTSAAFTLLLVGAMVSQVYPRDLLLLVIDGVNDEWITEKDGFMDDLKLDGAIGRFIARPKFLRSINPTKSLSTLHTVATGVLPNVHGVIANKMFDEQGAVMHHTAKQYNFDADIIPLWTQAVKKGIKTAVDGWPGSPFSYGQGNIKPDISVAYRRGASWDTRIDTYVCWLQGKKCDSNPAGVDIQFVMAYFDDILGEDDIITEDSQTYANRVQDAIKNIYNKLNQHDVDIIVMSDHGTKEVQKKNVFNIQKLAPEDDDYKTIASGPISFIRFDSQNELETTYEALKSVDLDGDHQADYKIKFKLYKSNAKAMKEWNMHNNKYLDKTIFVAALSGYTFYDEKDYQTLQQSTATTVRENGYLRDDADMNGILLCIGPSFKDNKVIDAYIKLEDVYHISKRLLDITETASNKQEHKPLSKNIKRLVELQKLNDWDVNPVADNDNDYEVETKDESSADSAESDEA